MNFRTSRPERPAASLTGRGARGGDAQAQERAVEAELDRLDALLAAGELERMETVLRGPSDGAGGLAERMLSWMVGRWLG